MEVWKQDKIAMLFVKGVCLGCHLDRICVYMDVLVGDRFS